MPGIHAHRNGAAWPHAVDPTGGPFDVCGIDVAARHDDDVLEPPAHHDVASLGQVAEIPRVIPAVVVLGRDEASCGGIPTRHGIAAHLDDADAARGQHGAVDVDDASLQSLEQTAERGQPTGAAVGRWDRPT